MADPAANLRAAASWPDGPIEREAVTRALRRLARQDVATAASQWESLAARFSFAAGERSSVLHDIALQAAASYRPDAGRWFQQVPEEARSESLMEWELRAALAVRDWGGVLALVRGLSPELASAARSRYWQARALEETGANDDARALFAGLATEANFHGFLAADRLDAPYAICPEEIPAEPARLAALRGNGELARALELRAIGWQAHASRAWEHARRSASETDRRQMLLVASEEGWHDRAIYALNTGGDLRQYALRFPVAERDTVIRESSANGLDPAWTYALIRAESAWQPDARSGANAYGLMQLLPGTGQQMARQLGIPWSGTRMLLDPQANIRLGTRYLSQQAARFGGSPWLASAAYNAGPAAVQRWLDARHALPADVFIETIPYRETREYVMRVMAFSVIYDWRLSGKAHPLSARLPAPGSPWAPRDRGSPRTVTCPLPG